MRKPFWADEVDVCITRFWDMLVSRVCLQEQKKQSFLTLAKENQSALGLYRNLPTFFFTNPRFVLLIHVLSPRSSLITQQTLYVIRVPQFDEVREKSLLRLKYGYFSYKNTRIRYRRPLFTPRSRVMHVLLWMRVLYLTSFGLLNRNTRPLQW